MLPKFKHSAWTAYLILEAQTPKFRALSLRILAIGIWVAPPGDRGSGIKP